MLFSLFCYVFLCFCEILVVFISNTLYFVFVLPSSLKNIFSAAIQKKECNVALELRVKKKNFTLYVVTSSFIMGSLHDCCAAPDQSQRVNTEQSPRDETAGGNKGNKVGEKLEISAVVVIDYIISLNESELIEAWNEIDKNKNNTINIDRELKKLFIKFIDNYIASKISDYNKNTNHKYATISIQVARGIAEDFESTMSTHDINLYEISEITKSFYLENFQKYLREIKQLND